MNQKKIGVIGAGARALGFGKNIIQSDYDLCIAALSDKYKERMAETGEMLEKLSANENKPLKIRRYSDYKELIDDKSIDLVMITTPQYFHEEPMRYALKKNKLVFCEKPLAHNMDAIENMHNAWIEHGRKNVMVGFTRRYENSWNRAKEIIDAGWIGDVKMIQLRSVIPGSTYFHKWFSKIEYSGGVLNEKCAHHFDVINWFAANTPEKISAMGDRIVYTPKGNAPKFCKDCDRDCEYRYSHEKIFKSAAAADSVPLVFRTAADTEDILLAKDKCVYSKDTKTFDHAIVNLAYKNGIKAQLFLSIFGYRTEDQETLEVVGDKGKLHLERHSGTIKVDYNYGREHMVIDAKDPNHKTAGHCGADLVIVKTINDFIRKGIEPPANVYDGYIASRMSFLATKSCETNKVYEI